MSRIRGPVPTLSCALAILLATAALLVFAARTPAEPTEPEFIPVPSDGFDPEASDAIASRPTEGDPLPDDVVRIDEPLLGEELLVDDGFTWRWLPTGLIYRSYWAGVHEPRLALFAFSDLDGQSFWDATLGGRVGLLQYGDGDPLSPDGYQIDFYGAAIPRLDVDHEQDLVATDYVFGFPVTWGVDQWQWKCGYAHLSSHLGDEFAIRTGTLGDRVNYVRDSIVLGTSYYVNPAWRLYGEVGYAFHSSGGAKPFESQLGTEYSQPGPTCDSWVPFVAVNGRLRGDDNWNADVALQTGYLRRNILGQTIRLGAQYYNGNSSQFEFFRTHEQQLGLGVWYDF